MLADRLGYVQLAEAVRFTNEWEREASLGLRRGEIAALEEYDRHGRISGDEPDLALDQARRTDGVPVGSYLASYSPEGDQGNGVAEWTRDPAQAMTFASAQAATECYRAVPYNRPLRPDGKPNRPLTMFSVAFW